MKWNLLKIIAIISVFIYIVASLLLILFLLWTQFKNTTLLNAVNEAYGNWRREIVQTLFKQAYNEKCDAFDVSLDNKVVKLINVECIKAKQ